MVDSGATQHMFKDRRAFSRMRVLPELIAVMTAQEGATTFATEIGTVISLRLWGLGKTADYTY